MYYLESRETKPAYNKLPPIWKPVCYSAQRESLDEAVRALGKDNYRVTLGVVRNMEVRM